MPVAMRGVWNDTVGSRAGSRGQAAPTGMCGGINCWWLASPHPSWLLVCGMAQPVRLRHPDGYPMGFFVGLLHHEAEKRTRQWDTLRTYAPAKFLRNTTFPCDHNSVVMPSRDTAAPHLAPERFAVLHARETKSLVLSKLNLLDAYPCMGRVD